MEGKEWEDFAWGPHVRLGRQTQEMRKGAIRSIKCL